MIDALAYMGIVGVCSGVALMGIVTVTAMVMEWDDFLTALLRAGYFLDSCGFVFLSIGVAVNGVMRP